jgi:hypothetical protein
VKFLARGRGFVFLGSGETVLGLSTPDASQAPAVRMKLLGANPRRVPWARMSPRARSTTSPGRCRPVVRLCRLPVACVIANVSCAPLDGSSNGSDDAFVIKLNPAGSAPRARR